MIRIMHVLCADKNCVAKYNFHLTMFEMDNKRSGALFIIAHYVPHTRCVS